MNSSPAVHDSPKGVGTPTQEAGPKNHAEHRERGLAAQDYADLQESARNHLWMHFTQSTKEVVDAATSNNLSDYLPTALFQEGLCCRSDDRRDTAIHLAPPLIGDQHHFDEMEQKLREGLSSAPQSF